MISVKDLVRAIDQTLAKATADLPGRFTKNPVRRRELEDELDRARRETMVTARARILELLDKQDEAPSLLAPQPMMKTEPENSEGSSCG